MVCVCCLGLHPVFSPIDGFYQNYFTRPRKQGREQELREMSARRTPDSANARRLSAFSERDTNRKRIAGFQTADLGHIKEVATQHQQPASPATATIFQMYTSVSGVFVVPGGRGGRGGAIMHSVTLRRMQVLIPARGENWEKSNCK